MIKLFMPIGDSPEEIRAAVLGLAAVSLVQMRAKRFPRLYAAGIRYKREPRNREQWQTAALTLRLRTGDCEDLAAYRLAELHRLGETGATIAVKVVRPELRHILVRRASGVIEDPSKRLGM